MCTSLSHEQKKTQLKWMKLPHGDDAKAARSFGTADGINGVGIKMFLSRRAGHKGSALATRPPVSHGKS